MRFLTVFIFLLTISFQAHAQDGKAEKPEQKPVLVSPQQLPPNVRVHLFAELDNQEDIPFRFDIKEDSDSEVKGYFPAGTIVKVRYWSNPWVLAEYADMMGWVKNTSIRSLITPDSHQWLPANRPAQ